MHRVVVDTNVIVSGFRGGRPRQVLDLWRAGRIIFCVSDAILHEYLEVLDRFGDLASDIPAFSARLRDSRYTVNIAPREHIRVASDPGDDMFLACALAAGADMIVSGDRHLLALGAFRGIPILAPAEALGVLSV